MEDEVGEGRLKIRNISTGHLYQYFKGNEKNQRRNREQGPTCMGKETKVTRAVMEALAGTTRRKRRRVVLLVSIF